MGLGDEGRPPTGSMVGGGGWVVVVEGYRSSLCLVSKVFLSFGCALPASVSRDLVR